MVAILRDDDEIKSHHTTQLIPMKFISTFYSSKLPKTRFHGESDKNVNLAFLKSNFKYKRRSSSNSYNKQILHLRKAKRRCLNDRLPLQNCEEQQQQQQHLQHRQCDIGRVLKKSDNFFLRCSFIRFIAVLTVIIYHSLTTTLRQHISHEYSVLLFGAMCPSTIEADDHHTNSNDDDDDDDDDDDNVDDGLQLCTTETISSFQHSNKNNNNSKEHKGRCARKARRCQSGIMEMKIISISMTFVIAFGLTINYVDAGACWRKNLLNGKCSEIFSLNITKSECCSTSEEFSFTDRELTSVEYFFATAIGGGMECSPCLDSCKNVACGQNKKCAKRRGRPKCVCALECGGGGLAKKSSKFFTKSTRRIGTIVNNNEHFPLANFAKSIRDIRSLSSEIVGPSALMNGGGGDKGDINVSDDANSSNNGKQYNGNQRKSIIISSNPTKLNSKSQQKHISSISSSSNSGSDNVAIASRRQIVMSVPTVTRHQVISSNSNLNSRTATATSSSSSSSAIVRRNKNNGKSSITTEQDMMRRNSRNNDFADLPSASAIRRKSVIMTTTAVNRSQANDFVHRQQQQQKKEQQQHRRQQQQHHHNRHQLRKHQAAADAEANSKRKFKDHNSSSSNRRGKWNVDVHNKTATTMTTTRYATDKQLIRDSTANAQKLAEMARKTTITTAATTTTITADELTFDDRIYNTFYMNSFANPLHELSQMVNIRYNHPVCGTDGRTYNTECQLRKRACRTDNADLVVAYPGHCRTTCNGIKCLNGLTCVEDHYMIPHCISCKIDCVADDKNPHFDPARAVCGVDGKTYKSVCDINRMVCRIGRSIAVAYPGPCRDDHATCSSIVCGQKMTCLKDLVTQEPRCVSCRFKCSRKRRPGGLHFEDGKICGTNNRSYHSWCEMRKDSCSTGLFIDIKSLGDC